ncbi:MAG: ATP-binding protein [Planctomycetaceae bacterium]
MLLASVRLDLRYSIQVALMPDTMSIDKAPLNRIAERNGLPARMSSTTGLQPAERAAEIAPPPISRWTAVGLGGTLIFFSVTAALSYLNQQRFVETEALASSSRLLLAKVEELTSQLQAAETMQRAYLFTEQQEFRRAYEKAFDAIPQQLEDLNELADSAEQQTAIAGIRNGALARLANLKETLEIYENQGREAAQREVATGRGHELMRMFYAAAGAFNTHERKLFTTRRREAADALAVTHISDLIAAAIGLGLAALAFVRLRREFVRRYEIAQVLDEQRDLLQVTLHSIGDAVVTTDPRGQVRSLNAVAERLLGHPGDAAVGRPLAEVFRVVSEQTRVAVENPAVRAIREGQGIRQAQNTLLIARDNTERRIDGSASPIRTVDGRVLGAVLTFRDVTDRKRSEDALRRSEERLRRALRASRMVAWEIDLRADVVIRSENVTDLIGLPPFGSVIEFLDMIHPDDRTEVEAALGGAMRGEGEYAVECRVMLADGRTLWMADKGELQRDDRGTPTHVAGVLVDITEVKQAETDLREADHRKDRFLATLAHELRNPLAPISNVIQTWPFVKDDPAELERIREMLERQVAQLTRLIDDLLDVSRITRGKIKLRRERANLKAVLDAAIECVRPLIDRRRHELRVSVPDPAPDVDGDEARLVQAFTNLLNNAAKYTDEGGEIEVIVRLEAESPDGPRQAVIAIRDNGPGIPRTMLMHIFDMFSQVDQTLERSHGGLGIGLTLVRTLVELHGGHIEAKSDGPGKGSTFVTTLPVANGTADSAVGVSAASHAATAEPVADRGNPPSLRVLVVDDMRPSARTLAMMLKGIGQQTRVVHDGVAALEAVEEFRPDIVMLDIAMPGMDGYEVCRRLRQRPGHQPMLVALTGYGQEEDRRRAFDAGFDKHLVKPTSLDALRTLLAEVRTVHPQPASVD